MFKFLRKLFLISLLALCALVVFVGGNIVLLLLLLTCGLAAKGTRTVTDINNDMLLTKSSKIPLGIMDPRNIASYSLQKRYRYYRF